MIYIYCRLFHSFCHLFFNLKNESILKTVSVGKKGKMFLKRGGRENTLFLSLVQTFTCMIKVNKKKNIYMVTRSLHNVIFPPTKHNELHHSSPF